MRSWVDPNFAVADLDRMARQRARRRTGQHAAVLGAEKTLVAGTIKLPLLVLIIHRAHEMRAVLAVGGEFVVAQPHEDRGMMPGRVSEELAAADGHLLDARDELGRRAGGQREEVVFRGPAPPDGEGGAAAHL